MLKDGSLRVSFFNVFSPAFSENNKENVTKILCYLNAKLTAYWVGQYID